MASETTACELCRAIAGHAPGCLTNLTALLTDLPPRPVRFDVSPEAYGVLCDNAAAAGVTGPYASHLAALTGVPLVSDEDLDGQQVRIHWSDGRIELRRYGAGGA